MKLVFLARSCKNITWCTRRVHYEFLHTSSMPLEKGLSIITMIAFALRPILMLDTVGTKGTKEAYSNDILIAYVVLNICWR